MESGDRVFWTCCRAAFWPELRRALVEAPAIPRRWREASRWYRRASCERPPRERFGRVIKVVLDELRAVDSLVALRRHYAERDGDWTDSVVAAAGLRPGDGGSLRRIEDAAYGMRWLEISHAVRVDPARSLVAQIPARVLD
jgi:hypothetical protein